MILERILSLNLRNLFVQADMDENKIQEIRLRVNKPVFVVYDSREYMLDSRGKFTNDYENAYRTDAKEIRETMEYVSNYSMYAYEDELRQGFITVPGGHRVGICGKIIIDSGKIKTIKYISFLNIRLAHQMTGCSDKVMKYLEKDKNSFHSTLIISPPACGKTTFLRDVVRNISNHKDMSVGLIDERSELAACYMGVPGNDVGMRTDVLDGCPKSEGIMMLVRTMAPKMIAVDEIGGKADVDAILYALKCGAGFLCTIHGDSFEGVRQSEKIKALIERKVFGRIVVLNKPGRDDWIEGIYDYELNKLY